MNAPLKLIGHWKGLGEDAHWPHPRFLVDPDWERERRRQLVSYLQSGIVVLEMLGYSSCRFAGGPPDNQMGCTTLSDGVWAWPEGLSIYVRHYSVRLPDEFVAHMAANQFQVPEGLEPDELTARGFDLSFWRTWSEREVPPLWSWKGLRLRLAHLGRR